MVRVFVGVIVLVIGILVFLGGIRGQIQVLLIEQIPIVGNIILAFSSDQVIMQMMFTLIGLLLIVFGIIIARSSKK